ncbi:MAG: hypothetical protein EHM61_07700 [Acidobacteria bacterium]|nr:MAG: hypothetical protein EHM61_07700 [Acidobacteriota bacterium]
MLCVMRSFLVLGLYLSLSVFISSQSAPASMQAPELIYGSTSVEWPASVPDGSLLLTVSGPQGLYLRQEHPAGNWASFSLIDERDQLRPDGVYKWELVVQAGREAAGQRTRSGWFQIQGGRVVGEGTVEKQPVVVEGNAPGSSVYVDQEGRVGIGTSVPGAQLHLKGTAPALAIEDTQEGGREYRLRSLESGDGSLGLIDQATGQARWLVDGEGRMGINTTKPTSTLTVDGYIEATKGFLVNGRPVGGIGFGLLGGSQPLVTEGGSNNYFGTGAGAAMTSGYSNSFFGGHAGEANANGFGNSFFGAEAGRANTSGYFNAYFGNGSGAHSTTGIGNAYFGSNAGQFNVGGYGNSFIGHLAGYRNTEGDYNSFVGRSVGENNTLGGFNCFIGAFVGEHNTVEDRNTLVGTYADIDPGVSPGQFPVHHATAIGYGSYVSRSNSLILGGVNGFNDVTSETFVGIGTPAPDRQLVVEGSQALGKFRRYNATTPSHSPAFLFERARGTNTAPLDIVPGDYLGKVQFRGRVSANMPEYGALVFIASDTNQNGRFSFVDRDLATERMVVLNTGNVGIGTNTPTELLDIAGNLRVRGTILFGAPASPVPDYVFQPEYRLMPLRELEQYVKAERHLPNVPSASAIQSNGVNLGEFQMKLLEKIEELTLYTLQQANVIERQNHETSALKEEAAAEARALKERIKALEETVKTLVGRDNRGR